MVLSKNEIKNYCSDCKMIFPYKEELVQTCSYDLTFSGEYYYYCKDDGDFAKIKRLKYGEKLAIPPDAICYILTEETVTIPANLTASISLAFGLIKKGVMLANQPPYDPGYHGKTVALLHNLSDEAVIIEKGQHVINMVFTQLSSQVAEEELYSGKYQNLESLEQYCTQVRKGAVYVLAERIREQEKSLMNIMPRVMTAISVTIAVLTILVTLITTSNLLGFSSGDIYEVMNENGHIVFSIPGDVKKLTFTVNGGIYTLDLEESDNKALGE